ncbi:MAG TPA: cytochrome b/b6 domain-containing protein [Caldilineaceae bacterium]|nr:cytochrome b/b6 domain-containing protein [Caldilineaceae bacterium]
MSEKAQTYRRFDRWQRIEHGLLILSFTVLTLTGLPQKYSMTYWGSALIWLFGGIEVTRLIHRGAAILLMLETIYHAVAVSYKVLVRRVRLTMLPSWRDIVDGFHAMAYNVRLAKTPPRMGRYTFGEKVEYWAVIWGTVIMILTGFMLWNPIATTTFFPGQWIPAAKAAHSGEALLAVLSIVTWHVYNVHLKHFNRSMFTGAISHHEMQTEHAAELAELDAGHQPAPIATAVLQRRQRIFYPVAIVLSLVLLVALYLFVTIEQTAITTVPRQQVEVFTPQTPEASP